MNSKNKLPVYLAGVGLALAGTTALAQTVSVGNTTPAVGAGVEYLGDSGASQSGNVQVHFVSSDYIAGDNNTCLGQTFTTGANAGGYDLSSFSFMQVANYTTYWQINNSFGYRFFSTGTPTQSGNANTYFQPISLLQTGTVTFPGAADQIGVHSGTPGASALWVTITLASPILLSANTQYGFDLQTDGTGGNSDFFMEWNGNLNGASTFSGGQAIVDGSNGDTPDPGSQVFLGDGPSNGVRTFVATMVAVPEPSVFSLAGLAGLVGVAVSRLRRSNGN
jgi:hypothetical protein